MFSYRADVARPDRLYDAEGSYDAYRKELQSRSRRATCRVVATADIADFYPRINLHRLENALASVAASQRVRDATSILFRTLGSLSDGNSYGIPVGPLASRTLGEAILIDVDEALIAEGYRCVRWVDDFNLFCRTDAEARSALFFLGEWLFDKHGLTLQPGKTRVFPASLYRTRMLVDRSKRLSRRVAHGKQQHWQALFDFLSTQIEYLTPGDITLDADEIAEIKALEIENMFLKAIKDTSRLDYEMASFLLGQLGALRSLPVDTKVKLMNVVLAHVEKLYPIAESIARFFVSFGDLPPSEKRKIGRALMAPLKASGHARPPDYYVMWALSIFSSSGGWVPTPSLLRLYKDSRSEVVKRQAAIALSQVATRQQALVVRDDFGNASPLRRLAILQCVRRLPADERTHWKRKTVISGILEREI